MENIDIIRIIVLPVVFILPIFILYYVIKLAIKNALKELKVEKVNEEID